ncbi:MAG: DUF4037 domain-containing protein [Erysipelotrichaceae bacterium]|nr:DUF4037 domain-containing protein [Erysipelotrichaceae bacterium]
MKGLELSRLYWLECGLPMIQQDFPELVDKIAAGLCGSGSECYGYDDETSRDHDFEPGFILFLPDESVIDQKTAFALEKAYNRLPKVFLGFKRSNVSPVGGNRHGVIRVSDYLNQMTGSPDGNLSTEQWLTIPDEFLAEAINGEIFHDPSGIIKPARKKLKEMPEDIFLKKLAGQLLVMGQSGQYNYLRCLQHDEPEAAQLSAFRYSEAAMKTIFLLNRKYMPYYKWSYRAFNELETLRYLKNYLYYLISTDNSEANSKTKKEMIEAVALLVIGELRSQGLSDDPSEELEQQAYSLNEKISDANIRNLSIFYTV